MFARMKMDASRWAEFVEAWKASGESGSAFAASRGIKESALRWWKGELARRAQKTSAQSPAPNTRETVALARVVREGQKMGSRAITVAIGHARVVVEPGFDPLLLRAIVQTLGAQP